MPGAQKQPEKIGELQPSSPCVLSDFAFFQLIGPAGRTRFSKSCESPVIRIFSAGAQGWIVMGKPGKECQFLEMIVEAIQGNHGKQSSGERIAHFKIALASAYLANDAPWSYRRGSVVSKWIIKPLGNFMGGNGNIGSAAEQGLITAFK